MTQTIPRNLARFTVWHLRVMPRPAGYLDELRACAVKVGGVWEFDEDSPCFKRLRAKYKDYVPTPEDWARANAAKAEWRLRDRAARDQRGRELWAMLHRRALSLTEVDDGERGWLAWFARHLPCGDCITHWRAMLERTPPDLSSPAAYFAWGVARHNEVNARLGKLIVTVDQARYLWDQGKVKTYS